MNTKQICSAVAQWTCNFFVSNVLHIDTLVATNSRSPVCRGSMFYTVRFYN